mgnify:CR=1 FL=1
MERTKNTILEALRYSRWIVVDGLSQTNSLTLNAVVWIAGCTGTLVAPDMVVTAGHCGGGMTPAWEDDAVVGTGTWRAASPITVKIGPDPDAPVVEHCIRVLMDDETYWVAPVLFSRTPRYDPETGGTFFRYLEFRLMAIDRKTSAAILKDSKPLLLKPDAVEGFYEQIGRNTGYIIHPEETLANNFVHLMQKKQDLKNPEIPKKIEQLLLAE